MWWWFALYLVYRGCAIETYWLLSNVLTTLRALRGRGRDRRKCIKQCCIDWIAWVILSHVLPVTDTIFAWLPMYRVVRLVVLLIVLAFRQEVSTILVAATRARIKPYEKPVDLVILLLQSSADLVAHLIKAPFVSEYPTVEQVERVMTPMPVRTIKRKSVLETPRRTLRATSRKRQEHLSLVEEESPLAQSDTRSSLRYDLAPGPSRLRGTRSIGVRGREDPSVGVPVQGASSPEGKVAATRPIPTAAGATSKRRIEPVNKVPAKRTAAPAARPASEASGIHKPSGVARGPAKGPPKTKQALPAEARRQAPIAAKAVPQPRTRRKPDHDEGSNDQAREARRAPSKAAAALAKPAVRRKRPLEDAEDSLEKRAKRI